MYENFIFISEKDVEEYRRLYSKVEGAWMSALNWYHNNVETIENIHVFKFYDLYHNKFPLFW